MDRAVDAKLSRHGADRSGAGRAERPDAAKQQLLQARAAQLLVSLLSSEVGRVVEQTFGVDTFQITPVADGSGGAVVAARARRAAARSASASPTRVYLTFSSVAPRPRRRPRDQVILLEHRPERPAVGSLSQNEDRIYALDVRVRHAF